MQKQGLVFTGDQTTLGRYYFVHFFQVMMIAISDNIVKIPFWVPLSE